MHMTISLPVSLPCYGVVRTLISVQSGAWLEEIGGLGACPRQVDLVFSLFLSLLPASYEVSISLPSHPSPQCFFCLAIDLKAVEPAGQGL